MEKSQKQRIANRWIGRIVLCLIALFGVSAATGGEQLYFYHVDHLGTPQVMTDEQGQVVWQGHYQPFGRVEVVTESVVNNVRFPGQYYDQESNNYYNYYRDYDPSTGRYLQSDPIGLDGGINTYAYAEANPLKLIDRFGLSATCVCSVECASVPVTALVRCSRVRTCVYDDDCNKETTTTEASEWYIWTDRPFYFVGSFDCSKFPGTVPGYPAPWDPPMS
jgi:RHS repeat-associated protein